MSMHISVHGKCTKKFATINCKETSNKKASHLDSRVDALTDPSKSSTRECNTVDIIIYGVRGTCNCRSENTTCEVVTRA
jgi:hypothetical protein